jgi:hypothetical protein
MAHGEAEQGCADGDRRVREPEPIPAGRQLRRVCDPLPVPPAEPSAADKPPVRACRSELPGWAGAHRHGAVRPRRRASRRERPPDRWC